MSTPRTSLTLILPLAAIAAPALLSPPTAHAGWDQTEKLLANDGAAGDVFGTSVGISGTTAIVGAQGDDDNGSGSGSAYLYDTTNGNELFKLTASDGDNGDLFGRSVAISGTTAIVGAQGDDDNGTSSGSAYLFDTTNGSQIAKLTASDNARTDSFGSSVAINGTTAIIGATGVDFNFSSEAGAAYIFDTNTGNQLLKLTASDPARVDRLGTSVGISTTTAIVGAGGDDNDNGQDAGAAYLFDTNTGDELFKLTASDGGTQDGFGRSVGISGTTAIVGALGDDDNGSSSGSAYLFDTTSGNELFKLTASDGENSDFFGRSVAISGTTAIVGVDNDDDNGTNSGSAYLFDTTTGDQIAKITASDGAASDDFGRSVAISGNTAIVGASEDEDNGPGSGSAYLFATDELSATPTTGSSIDFIDIDPDTSVNLDGIISLTNTGGPGSTIDVLSFDITGDDAALFDLPGFASATLTAGSSPGDTIAHDLEFLGSEPGTYAANLTLQTDAGNVTYDLNATVIPEPTSVLLFGIAATPMLIRRRKGNENKVAV